MKDYYDDEDYNYFEEQHRKVTIHSGTDKEIVREKDGYGLCSKCKNLCVQTTKHYGTIAWCYHSAIGGRGFTFKPNKYNPIKHCTFFSDVSYRKLDDLYPFAWRIKIEKVRKVGFESNLEEETIVKITRPEEG